MKVSFFPQIGRLLIFGKNNVSSASSSFRATSGVAEQLGVSLSLMWLQRRVQQQSDGVLFTPPKNINAEVFFFSFSWLSLQEKYLQRCRGSSNSHDEHSSTLNSKHKSTHHGYWAASLELQSSFSKLFGCSSNLLCWHTDPFGSSGFEDLSVCTWQILPVFAEVSSSRSGFLLPSLEAC